MDDKLQKAFAALKDQYFKADVCMAELLAATPISQFEEAAGSKFFVEDAFELYVEAMKWAEGDKFYQVKDGMKEEL